MTYTYAVLEVSPAAHAEIKAKLLAAGYQHAIEGDTIDMQGIALEPEEHTQAHQNTPAIAGTSYQATACPLAFSHLTRANRGPRPRWPRPSATPRSRFRDLYYRRPEDDSRSAAA